MKRFGLIAAISLLLAVNALVLFNVANNRDGQFDAEVTLTERELPIVYSWRRSDKENTGMSLQLDWDIYDPEATVKEVWYRRRQAAWFDQAKLESIGFDCSRPLTSEGAGLFYGKMLPRKTFVVLEYEGTAWQNWKDRHQRWIAEKTEEVRRGKETRKNLAELKKKFDTSLKTRSRLFAVDAGNDAAQLRRKYQERGRYIIAPAKVRLAFHFKKENGREIKYLEGVISEILVDEINVPLSKREVLDQLIKNEKNRQHGYRGYGYMARQRPPSYTVVLRYGKRFEPWIVGIEKITDK